MPVSEKQKGYARKWDKEHMRTLSTAVRIEDAEEFKAWCKRQGISTTAAIKKFVMSELDKYHAVLDEELEKELRGKK